MLKNLKHSRRGSKALPIMFQSTLILNKNDHKDQEGKEWIQTGGARAKFLKIMKWT